MTFFKVLLCAALILQAVCGDSSSRGRRRNYSYDRSGQDLTNLFNSRVQKAERVWSPTTQTKDFDGRKTVSDFVRAGGGKYNTALDNCHWAARRMMNQ
ncbi:uncharacterized protein LOC124865984 [Girardinichthys multiradiatus]|uniref:uncharacterized protein LOC124865984 n=1 Tax=Girardinichthys multiradiatus TaxID=208333 RepID=UPI001FAE4960|nr:uncharacterized protein LOC124865984 [Girardinichthys multiradiatus]